MILILAEKPSVARDIANALPGQKQNQKTHIVAGNYIVTWGFGHLVTLYDARDYNPEYQIWKIETLP
ncbi:MAG: toprim domain-containing protein, partial [Candidatus Methanomethylicaceae archaeon]